MISDRAPKFRDKRRDPSVERRKREQRRVRRDLREHRERVASNTPHHADHSTYKSYWSHKSYPLQPHTPPGLPSRVPPTAHRSLEPKRPALELKSNGQHPSQECPHYRHDDTDENLLRLQALGFPFQENGKDKAPDHRDFWIEFLL